MDILQGLGSILGGALEGDRGGQSAQTGAASGGLGGLLGSDVLGSLAGALLGGKSGGVPSSGGAAAGAGGLGGLLSAVLAGGGSDLLGKLAGMMGGGGDAAPEQSSGYSSQGRAVPAPPSVAPSASPATQAMRLIRTLVYAAKADGHIDDQEQAAIRREVGKLDLGPEVNSMIQKAMDEQLDPARIADGVTDAKEALKIYALSSAISNPDNFMEKSYLDGLANALRIPGNVKATVDDRVRGNG